jgi:hypothetical protein
VSSILTNGSALIIPKMINKKLTTRDEILLSSDVRLQN